MDFGPDGPAGNRTAVHTEQVLAFAAEHYDYWTKALEVPRADWDWCHWGENLTIAGLDESRLCIGDILEIGARARFQVTSPRTPCFKLAWRLGQPESVLRRITETGRVGVYLSVLTPGQVAAGDEVRRLPAQGQTVTVAEVARLGFGLGEAREEQLTKVLALAALGGQARGMLTRRLAALRDGERLNVGRWKGWRAFDIVAVSPAADDICAFELAAADGQPIAPYRAGQFLTVRLAEDASQAAPSRTWSLSDYCDQPETYRLTIKRLPGGLGSAWMHDLTGTRVLARPPAGRFTLDRGGFIRTVLISAGIGVTPMLAMLKAHAAREDPAPLLWLHTTRNRASHVLAVETTALLRKHGFEGQVFYTAPDACDRLGEDFDHAGRPTPELLRTLIGAEYEIRPFGRSIPMEGTHSDFYLCGPPSFEAMVRASLLAMGVAEGAIRSESFSTLPGERSRPVERAEVRFTRSNLTAAWSLDDDISLLELAESLGLEPEYACRMGLCGSCETALNEGSVDYDPRPLEPPPPGRVLACCARPASERVAIDL